jgi:serine/threonine protein kinase
LIKEDGRYNNKVDIFALGCILYELVCGTKAFSNDYEIREWSFGHEEKVLPDHEYSQDVSMDTISKLVARTLLKDPSDRPSSKTVCDILRAFFGHSIATDRTAAPTISSPEKPEKSVGSRITESNRGRRSSLFNNPQPNFSDQTQQNWLRVRSSLPPWLNLETKMPILCHEIKVVIRLSGRGFGGNASWTSSSEAYCILFENMLLFAQGSFPASYDETAAPTMPNLTCLGMVFLENLDPQILSQLSVSSGSLSFRLNLGVADSITFKFGSAESTWVSKSWYHTLQTCLQSSTAGYGAACTYLKVTTSIR